MKKLHLLLVFLLVPLSLYAQNFWMATNGPVGGSVRSLAINSSGHIFAGTYGSGVFRSTNNGSNWTAINSDSLTYSYVYSLVINSSGHIFAGTYGNGAFRSTDNGNSWTQINSGLTSRYVNALALNSSGNIFAGTRDNGVFRSTDNGNNWTQIISGLTNINVNALGINSGANGAIFAGTHFGNIYRSINNGSSWSLMRSDLFPNSYSYVSSFAINSSGHIFAGDTYYLGVFRSVDNGNTWTQLISGRMGNTHVSTLAINRDGHIFAGTYGDGDGVLRSIDNGSTWTIANSGLNLTTSDSYIPSLAINSGGFIFAGTNNGTGVFRSVSTTTSIKESGKNIPNEFLLSQNYPNPFNPATTIEFSLPKSTEATLKIFDVLGREVATLVNERLNAGTFKVEWDAKNMPSGTYFYRIQAGDFVATKKLILMK